VAPPSSIGNAQSLAQPADTEDLAIRSHNTHNYLHIRAARSAALLIANVTLILAGIIMVLTLCSGQ
jgi:hypothetical protein